MRNMTRHACLLMLIPFTVAALASIVHAGETLDVVRARDSVRCGVSTGLAGFAIADNAGHWTGLDVDFCRALAAAVLDDGAKVTFVPLSNQQRFTALQAGEVDLLSRNTTWTLTRDASLGLMFAGVTFYDGQGFMVPRDIGVYSASELAGAEVCVLAGTTTELNLADYFRANNMRFRPIVFESLEEAKTAFFQRAVAKPTPPTAPVLPPSSPPMRQTRTTTSVCPKPSPRSPWARWFGAATTTGSPSSSGWFMR